MTKIIIFEDGKRGRGMAAKLIKRGNKRVLIEFEDFDYETNQDVVVTEWFNLFIPYYSRDKVSYKHNNKRKHASYCHERSNYFYSDELQTEDFKVEMKEWCDVEYYEELYGE